MLFFDTKMNNEHYNYTMSDIKKQSTELLFVAPKSKYNRLRIVIGIVYMTDAPYSQIVHISIEHQYSIWHVLHWRDVRSAYPLLCLSPDCNRYCTHNSGIVQPIIRQWVASIGGRIIVNCSKKHDSAESHVVGFP